MVSEKEFSPQEPNPLRLRSFALAPPLGLRSPRAASLAGGWRGRGASSPPRRGPWAASFTGSHGGPKGQAAAREQRARAPGSGALMAPRAALPGDGAVAAVPGGGGGGRCRGRPAGGGGTVPWPAWATARRVPASPAPGPAALPPPRPPLLRAPRMRSVGWGAFPPELIKRNARPSSSRTRTFASHCRSRLRSGPAGCAETAWTSGARTAGGKAGAARGRRPRTALGSCAPEPGGGGGAGQAAGGAPPAGRVLSALWGASGALATVTETPAPTVQRTGDAKGRESLRRASTPNFGVHLSPGFSRTSDQAAAQPHR